MTETLNDGDVNKKEVYFFLSAPRKGQRLQGLCTLSLPETLPTPADLKVPKCNVLRKSFPGHSVGWRQAPSVIPYHRILIIFFTMFLHRTPSYERDYSKGCEILVISHYSNYSLLFCQPMAGPSHQNIKLQIRICLIVTLSR